MKVLNIVSTPWRATLEEQDDTVVWLTHAMIGAGAEIDVVLTGEAAAYAATNQNAGGLAIGGMPQTQPPNINRDLNSLLEKGRQVFVCHHTMTQLGLHEDQTSPGITPLHSHELAPLMDDYDQIWQW